MPASTNTLQTPQTGRYSLDTTTPSVAFATRHMFGLGKVRGQFAVTRGTVTVADRIEDSALDIEISAASFSTRNPLRDGQVRSALFLSARRHPVITFRSTAVESGPASWVIPGTLTVKGTSAPVELTVTGIAVHGSSVVFTATATIDRYALGVTMMRGMAARHLTVQINARATLD